MINVKEPESMENLLKDLKLLIKQDVVDELQIIKLFSKIHIKQKCNEEGKTPNNVALCVMEIIAPTNVSTQICQHVQSNLHQITCWLKRSLENTEYAASCVLFAVVENIIKTHSEYATFFLERIYNKKVSPLLLHLKVNVKSIKDADELVFGAVRCLDIILSNKFDSQMEKKLVEICEIAASTILDLHFTQWQFSNTSNISQFFICSLSIFIKVIPISSNFAQKNISELFGLAKTLLTYNTDTSEIKPVKQQVSQQPFYNIEEEINPDTANCGRNHGRKLLKTRKARNTCKTRTIENADLNVIFRLIDGKANDSEMSDPERMNNKKSHERYYREKVRFLSITMLGIVASCQEHRVLYGYWYGFFPNGIGKSYGDLLFVSKNDNNVRCRSAALQVASQILIKSKDFTMQAESSVEKESSAYLPFAQSLGLSVTAIYDALLDILNTENSVPVLTRALKCLGVLIQGTSFQRTKHGIVKNIVKQVRPLINHRDSAIQVSALMTMKFLIAVPELTPDILIAIGLPKAIKKQNNVITSEAIKLKNNAQELDVYDDESVSESKKTSKSSYSWLLLHIFQNLHNQQSKPSTSVRIASLQVLSTMSANIALVSSFLEEVAQVLHYQLHDPLSELRLYAARCLDNWAYQINHYLTSKIGLSIFDVQQCEQFWNEMLPVLLETIHSTTEEISAVKVCFCDTLSNIGVHMFENFSHTIQLNLISCLSGVCSDDTEEVLVKAAAARALAVFVLFPSLSDNLVLIGDAAELTLNLVSNSNLHIRIKAVWSIGNISEALLMTNSQERISFDLLRLLMNASVAACNDNDKVRCNAVRTLGNLLRLLCNEHLTDRYFRGNTLGAIKKLIDCIRFSGNAKLKWNSCYAIGNLMQNLVLFNAARKYSDFNWQSLIYPMLCDVIVHHTNFKVRIHAASAIIHIKDRINFGMYYENLWCALMSAIEQSYNLDNYYEYNHRDNLQEQLCLTICHIVQIGNNNDFLMLRKHLVERQELVKTTWKRVTNIQVPEKTAPLLTCTMLLYEKLNQNELTAEHKNAIIFIANTFYIQ